ncbi:FkbM family methyltransferase [Thioclava sp. FR2]|uniref:FkbM family methyltransferase n=1 Tax=Thioclava sp. FR2 TaxID=3445780 RepID=UPI003EBDBE9C
MLQIWNHHKCATGFMTRTLNTIAEKNGLQFWMDDRGDADVSAARKQADILHIKNAHSGMLSDPDAGGIHIIRNPFSVVVSAYFSHLRTHAIALKTGTWVKLAQQRERTSVLNKRDGLSATIDFLLDQEFFPATPGPLHALSNWPYEDQRFFPLLMEEFVKAPVTNLLSAMAQSGNDTLPYRVLPDDSDLTFKKMSNGRSVGQTDETSHYRSGDPNDWKLHLEPEHRAAIRKACRPVFERFYPDLAEESKSYVQGSAIEQETLPDPKAEMASVKIGDITLAYRANDGGGKHYLSRGHSEEYLSRFYPTLRDALAPEFCIDVGANYGFTGLLMRRAFPDAHLTLVEPIPWLKNYITYNFATNRTTFDVLHSAIVSTNAAGTTSSFGVNERSSQDSRVIAQSNWTVVETPVVTLDQLASNVGADQSVYIKIDTQGWEERVFAGGETFLTSNSRWFIKTEFAPMWLESQGTDPQTLLRYLLDRYSVHESVARVRWNATCLDDLLGPPLVAGCEKDFVAYVRNLALQDKGWVDLYVLPLPAQRNYATGNRRLPSETSS